MITQIPVIKPRLPWDMLPEEDGWSYQLFCMYLQMLPGERSIKKVAEAVGRTKRNAEYFSARHRWVERARAYDENVLTKGLKENA